MDPLAGETPDRARKVHVRRGVLGRPILPFDRLDTPWKAKEAVGAGVLAAIFMAALNLASGAILWSGRYPDHWTLAWQLNISMPFLNLVAAILLMLLAANLHRTRSVVVAWTVFVWSLADVAMLSLVIYGHYPFYRVSPFLIFIALLGVRGAMRLRRFAPETTAPAPA